MSGDPEQEYFADGMVEEIPVANSMVVELSRITRTPITATATMSPATGHKAAQSHGHTRL